MRLLSAVLALSFCAAAADPVTWKVQESPQLSLKPGARFQVRLLAQIENGWHIFALRPVEGGPVATRIWVADGLPVQSAGAVQGPDPVTMLDTALNKDVLAYTGEALFTLPLRIASSADAEGPRRFAVNIAYQACDNKVCLPARTLRLDVTVTVTR